MAGMGMGGPMTENSVETIEIPESYVGMVIGRGGEQISAIQQQSGARVQMSSPEGNTSGFRTCTIQGPKPCIDKARQMVEEVLSRNRTGGMGQNGSGGHVTAEILIPGNKCGLIIGKGGETIKGLQESIGVKMLLVQDSQSVSVAPKPLRITGFPDKVEQAKHVVEQLLNEEMGGMGGMGGMGMGMGGMFGGPRGGGYGPRSIGEVIVPRSSVGIIIGKGGETIKRLAADSGAKIQFKPDEDPNAQDRCAVIQGSAEQINRATQMISDLVTRGAHGGGGGGGQEIFYMHVPANKVGLVIGKGGDTIKQICAESMAHVELSRDPQPNPNEKIFIIKGSPYQIHHVQHIIRIKVGDIAPGTPVPPFAGGGAPMGQLGGGNPYGPSHHAFGGGGDYGGGGGAQWSHGNVGGGGGPGGQQQDMSGSAWAQYYNQQQAGYAAAGGQPGYATAAAAPHYQTVPGLQQQQQQGQQQANIQGGAQPSAAPAINPVTGQADYSAQWCEYYRSMGMMEQAALIEAQMKQQGGQHPGVNPAAAGGGPQVGRPQQQVYYSS